MSSIGIPAGKLLKCSNCKLRADICFGEDDVRLIECRPCGVRFTGKAATRLWGRILQEDMQKIKRDGILRRLAKRGATAGKGLDKIKYPRQTFFLANAPNR